MSDLTLKFLIANLAAGVAILAVLILRKPVRTMFGAPFAYALWLLVPLVTIAALLPPRNIEVALPAAAPAPMAAPIPATPAAIEPPPPAPVEAAPTSRETIAAPQCAGDCGEATVSTAPIRTTAPATPDLLAFLWLAGAIAAIVWQLRNQSLFMADVRAGFAGPAVIGVLRPRIITPSDFEERFDAPEREIILAHETIHLTRNDARINAVVALVRCLCWFNPLVHAAAHFMRIDQELACDAAVVERHPKARGLYASALLKAQMAFRPLPLGCYWPAKAEHPLMQRIEMLKQARPGKTAQRAGLGVLALLAIGSGLAAWAANPPVTHYTTASAPAAPADRVTESTPPAEDAPAPLPAPEDPQQATPSSTRTDGFDPADPVYLRGKVERIEFRETNYSVFVRASSIARSEADDPRPDARLWELSPTSYWGDRDAVNDDLKDSQILVRGYNSNNKSCTPTCRLLTRGLVVPKPTALPPVPQSANFGVTEVNQVYDVAQTYSIVGRVQRIEFSDGVFDAYVLAEAEGLVPGRLFQVRSEYRFPRAEIERRLLDQRVRVEGWPARANISSMNLEMWSIYTNCAATCAMYGTDFLRDDDTRITPAGEKLTIPSPAPVRLFSPLPRWAMSENNLVLTAKVKQAKGNGSGLELVVEEITRAPSPSRGPRPGTTWTVYLKQQHPGQWASFDTGRSWVGHTVTFTSQAPFRIIRPWTSVETWWTATRDCEKACELLTTDAMTFD